MLQSILLRRKNLIERLLHGSKSSRWLPNQVHIAQVLYHGKIVSSKLCNLPANVPYTLPNYSHTDQFPTLHPTHSSPYKPFTPLPLFHHHLTTHEPLPIP